MTISALPQRIVRILSVLLLLLGAAGNAGAATYFACDCGSGADAQCVPGDDAAPGNTPATAWRSYDRLQDAFAGLAAGDNLRFCRGGAFVVEGVNRWVNSHCTAAQPCTVGAYTPAWASGDEVRPLILQSNGHAFSLTSTGDNTTQERGYTFTDLDVRCSACVGEAYGFMLYNDVDDVRLLRLRVSGFSIGVYLAGSLPCGADANCDARNERISLLASEIVDNTHFGWLGSGNDMLIADSRFLRNGAGGVFDHNIYLDEAGGHTRGARVLRNTLYRSSARLNNSCEGTSLAVHGEHDDVLIEGNLIHEDIGAAAQSCWGIAVSAAYASAEGFRRLIVRGNTVRNVGNTAIALSSCQDCVVENNVVVQQQPFYLVGVDAPVAGSAANDLAVARLTVRNNSFHITRGDSTGIRVGGQGTGHVIVSNAIQATYSGGTWACLSLDLPASAYSAVDNNVCGYVAATNHEWEHGSGALADWRSSSGFDLNSKAAAPGYTSAGAPAYDLSAVAANSPMVGAGHPGRSAPREFFGGPRSAPPDAGAHEWGVFDTIFIAGFQAL